MTLTVAAPFKPLSAVQRKVICARFPQVKLDEAIRTHSPAHINAMNCHPFTLGLMEDGQPGIAIQPQMPFDRLPTKQLSEQEYSQLIEKGIIEHVFDSNQRSLAFAFSYKIVPGEEARAYLVVDAIDLTKLNTIGTFGLELNLSSGLTEDRRVVSLQLSDLAHQFLAKRHYDPSQVYERRKVLTHEGLSWDGVKYVNLKVEESYRNKGAEGFYGIAQLLMTTALRLAAEQFFTVAYLLGTGQWQTYYFSRILGAQRSIRCPEYGYCQMMIVSFTGQPGFEHAERVLERRRYDAMTDWGD